jgi:hypothetical protein
MQHVLEVYILHTYHEIAQIGPIIQCFHLGEYHHVGYILV